MAPKNPLRLTRKTHFLAREHLRRFADGKGKIHVYRKGREGLIATDPDVKGLFSVDGIWSHEAETRMTGIEDRFWTFLDAFQAAPFMIDQDVVSEYFAMWRARVEFAKLYQTFEVPLVGVTPSNLKAMVKVLDSDGKEIEATAEDSLESRGVGFYSTDIQASARSNSGVVIQKLINHVKRLTRKARIRWGVIEVPDAVLVLPDRVTTFDIPVSPHYFLHGFTEDEEFSPLNTAPASNAAELNSGSFDSAYKVVVSSSPELLVRIVDVAVTIELNTHELARAIDRSGRDPTPAVGGGLRVDENELMPHICMIAQEPAVPVQLQSWSAADRARSGSSRESPGASCRLVSGPVWRLAWPAEFPHPFPQESRGCDVGPPVTECRLASAW